MIAPIPIMLLVLSPVLLPLTTSGVHAFVARRRNGGHLRANMRWQRPAIARSA